MPSGHNFSDDGFHNIGVKPLEGSTMQAASRKCREGMRGAHKTPSLRDVAITSPTSQRRLLDAEGIVEMYNRGGDAKDNLDPTSKAAPFSGRSTTWWSHEEPYRQADRRFDTAASALIPTRDAHVQQAKDGRVFHVPRRYRGLRPREGRRHLAERQGVQLQKAPPSAIRLKVGDTSASATTIPSSTTSSRRHRRELRPGLLSPGTVPQGTFDNEGAIEIECAIHPEMKLRVEVSR